MFTFEAERTGHATAPRIEHVHLSAGKLVQQAHTGWQGVCRLLVAVAVKDHRRWSGRLGDHERPVVECVCNEIVDQPCLTSDGFRAFIAPRKRDEFIAQRENTGRFASHDRRPRFGKWSQSVDQSGMIAPRGLEQALGNL